MTEPKFTAKAFMYIYTDGYFNFRIFRSDPVHPKAGGDYKIEQMKDLECVYGFHSDIGHCAMTADWDPITIINCPEVIIPFTFKKCPTCGGAI